MEQPIGFREWLYHNHGLTSLSQVRNQQKYVDAYGTYCDNVAHENKSDYEKQVDAWQEKHAPLTVTAFIVIMLLAMRFINY